MPSRRSSLTTGARAVVVAAILVAVSACTADSSDPDVDRTPATPTSAPTSDAPTTPPTTETPTEPAIAPSEIRAVPATQWQAMIDAGMIRPECPVRRRDQLRRVDLNFTDFEGQVRRGHIIIRADTAASTQRIFDRLFELKFPIRRMAGVERYGGDVAKSLAADNTSAFNCRRADQINAPFLKSPHANGRAIDINPVENPWMDLRCTCWTPSDTHAKRTPGPGKILDRGPVWKLFDAEGWIWQNIDVPDYMHFDTGYPSAPLKNP